MFPHAKFEPEEYGHSPGNGITPCPLSADPLATEGEATPGPDDINPYDEWENERLERRARGVKRDAKGDREPELFMESGGFGELDDSFEVGLPEMDADPLGSLFRF